MNIGDVVILNEQQCEIVDIREDENGNQVIEYAPVV
jgi:hypothetical protein